MTELLQWMFDGWGTAVAERGTRRLVRSRPASRKVRTTVFTAGPDPHIAPFYEYFAARIGAARNCVYMTGKGFESSPDCSSPGCENLAAGLITSISQALRRGVPVIRLQTHPVVSDFWHDRLKALITEFPHLFELQVLMDATHMQSPNLCAIDIDDPARNITEMMLETPRYLGTRRHQVATYAVFQKGHQMLARRPVRLTRRGMRATRPPGRDGIRGGGSRRARSRLARRASRTPLSRRSWSSACWPRRDLPRN
jgi:hypothetical protein